MKRLVRDGQLAEALGLVKKGRMDQALRLARALSDDPRRFLADQCSSRGQAAYVNQREAREMAVGLVVAGTTFEIPGRGPRSCRALYSPWRGRDVKLIRPKQLVEGFWLRKVSDMHELADGGLLSLMDLSLQVANG